MFDSHGGVTTGNITLMAVGEGGDTIILSILLVVVIVAVVFVVVVAAQSSSIMVRLLKWVELLRE